MANITLVFSERSFLSLFCRFCLECIRIVQFTDDFWNHHPPSFKSINMSCRCKNNFISYTKTYFCYFNIIFDNTFYITCSNFMFYSFIYSFLFSFLFYLSSSPSISLFEIRHYPPPPPPPPPPKPITITTI